ncbi:hypothetical protein ACHAL6_13725 [Proteiniclasticum sp. C24MP]|uniref:hypothetical protein n=1 Tax=Proteiniclasticum sp. C24MP TaxID=3374101 RepID=UPI00375505FE
MFFRLDDRKEPMKFRNDTASYMIWGGLLAAVAGWFWQPVALGALAVFLGFFSMKSPKGAWGIPVFILGVITMLSSIYR